MLMKLFKRVFSVFHSYFGGIKIHSIEILVEFEELKSSNFTTTKFENLQLIFDDTSKESKFKISEIPNSKSYDTLRTFMAQNRVLTGSPL